MRTCIITRQPRMGMHMRMSMYMCIYIDMGMHMDIMQMDMHMPVASNMLMYRVHTRMCIHVCMCVIMCWHAHMYTTIYGHMYICFPTVFGPWSLAPNVGTPEHSSAEKR